VAVSDTPFSRSVFNPALAVSPDGQHVSIVFYDKRNDDGSGNLVDLYLAESFDGGETWEANLRLSEVSSDLAKAPLTERGRMVGDYQGIAADVDFDTPAVACWIDTRSGSPDPFTVRVGRSRGSTFETWRRLRFSMDELADQAISALAADPDHDGISKFAEYPFALDPRSVSNSPVVVASIGGDAQSPTITLAFDRLRTLTDAVFAWQVSVDLINWEPIQPISQQITKSRNPLLDNVRTTFPRRESVAQFFRLVVRPAKPE
jgi:hypothetical protein